MEKERKPERVGRESEIEKKEEETSKETSKATIFRNLEENPERSIRAGNSKRTSERDTQKNLELKEISDYEGEVFRKLTEVFNAGLSNTVRVKMLAYCLEKRSFSDIMQTLRLNPASLKHHRDLLQASGLIKKTGKGKDTRYETTHLGETLLSFVQDVLKVVRIT